VLCQPSKIGQFQAIITDFIRHFIDDATLAFIIVKIYTEVHRY